MKLYPRVEPVIATQCVEAFCLERRSGRQWVYPGEWIVKRLDSREIEWWTDAELKAAFSATE